VRHKKRTSAAKAVVVDYLFTARLNPCPSFRDAFPFSFLALTLEPAVCAECAFVWKLRLKALIGRNLYGTAEGVPFVQGLFSI
jgi:hypothetical protein